MKQKIKFVYLIIFPLILSIILFNPLETYEFQPEKGTLISDNIYNISNDIDLDMIHKHFLNNYLERLFNIGNKYNSYNLKIEDLSENNSTESLKLSFKININDQNYTIPYQEKLKLRNILFKEENKIIPIGYIFTSTTDVLQYGTFKIGYKITLSRPGSEFFIKTFIFIIGWIAVCMLLINTHKYILSDNY